MLIAWNWFWADWNCHLLTKMQDLHCTREHCLLIKVFVPAPPQFGSPGCDCCCSVFSARIHKVCSWNTAWELQEDVLRLKLCVFLRGLISEKGMVHMFPRRSRTAALCTAEDSARALGGSSDSIPIAVWVFKRLREISARILSRVPSLPLALRFPFDLARATFPAPWSPREVCCWFAVGSAWVCQDYIAGCVTGQMAGFCLGLFYAFILYWWASSLFYGSCE